MLAVVSSFVPRVLSYMMARGAGVDALLRRFDLPQGAPALPLVELPGETVRAAGVWVCANVADVKTNMAICRIVFLRVMDHL